MTVLLLFAAGLTGCADGNDRADNTPYFHDSLKPNAGGETESGPQTEPDVADEDLYLIVEIDQIEESMRLYRYANGMEYRYYYGTRTRFYDKYGGRTTVMNFTEGSVVSLGRVDDEGILREAQVSDSVWTYDNITRFSVEETRKVLDIAGSRYKYDDSTYVFSGDKLVSMTDLAQGDTICVVGRDKQILSVNVTTGQGMLALENTELFEGSFLQLGNKIFAEVTSDMQMSVEEGTYKLVVANKGWGGSRDVTISRGETTTVDLDELKGEGPKVGLIRFLIDVEDAVLIIDGKVLDHSGPLPITYGEHSLGVVASGYDVWRRNLYVNSKEATLVIELKKQEEEKPTISTSESNNSQSESDKLTKAIQDLIKSQQNQNNLNTLRDLMTWSAI